jgi:hypothetical protein
MFYLYTVCTMVTYYWYNVMSQLSDWKRAHMCTETCVLGGYTSTRVRGNCAGCVYVYVHVYGTMVLEYVHVYVRTYVRTVYKYNIISKTT